MNFVTILIILFLVLFLGYPFVFGKKEPVPKGPSLKDIEEEIEREVKLLRKKQKKIFFCPKCGSIYNPADRFCGNCGIKLQP